MSEPKNNIAIVYWNDYNYHRVITTGRGRFIPVYSVGDITEQRIVTVGKFRN